MKSLIVTAHPSSKGFTHVIAKKYAEKKGESEIINLYSDEWRQPFVEFENPHNIPTNETQKRIQQKISEAEELVFIFPLWWGSVPAIMKNFIDQNFSADFAFRFENGKPIGLLKGKTARIFATCDAPGFFYKILFTPFFTTLNMFTLRFCGVKVKSSTLFSQKRKADEKQLEKWIEKVERLAIKN